jgi:hypothetical protein
MIRRQPKHPRPPRTAGALRITHPHAAGIDVHADVHWVAVPPEDAPPAPANLPAHTRLARQVLNPPGAVS